MNDVRKKTASEIETAVCRGLDRFAREYLDRVPRATRAYLKDDLLVVRLQGGLSLAEQRLRDTPGRGRDLVKEMRTDLVEMARPILSALVEEIIGIKVISLHHDISTVTGEELIIFTLVEAPPLLMLRK
jgi:uncharacterized protein YbcI